MSNTNLFLSITELLDRIRQPYILQFSKTASLSNFHLEPVLRDRNGSAVYEGAMNTPYRCDLVRKETFERVSVDAMDLFHLDAVFFDIGNMRVHFSSFSWDALTLDIEGMSQDAAEQVMRDWFLQWFDQDDSSPVNAEGLYGVVRFISDPLQAETVMRLTVDCGSAPAAAISELIEELCNHGASSLNFR
jgi:hypothetical protein